MTRKGKIFAGAAVILALGSAAAVAHRHGGWHHGGPPGWAGPHALFGLGGRLCRGNPSEKADLMLVRLEYRVKPTEAQKPAFEDLKSAVRSAAAKVAAACPAKPEPSAEAGGKPEPKPMTTRLAETEAQLAAALEGVKIVRPAAEKLYASLDEAQKKAVSEFGKGKGGKWGRHHDRWDRGDGDRRPPDRGPAPADRTPERE